MKSLSDALGAAIAIVPWLIGIVLAKGFWSTLFACIFPPWAWYLCVEHWFK